MVKRPLNGASIDPYRGPTEAESLAAIGTSVEEIALLADIFGMPSGLDRDNEALGDDDSDPAT